MHERGEEINNAFFSDIVTVFLQKINACTSVDSGPGKKSKNASI
jgi:hypothetical protein